MKRIIVIDDEQDFCYFIKRALEQHGYEVSTCSESTKAVDRVLSIKPDLILLDIKMPGMSGDTIAELLNHYEETKKIPIIFVSVLVEEEEARLRENRFGNQLILPKPVKIPELMTVIKHALGEST